MDVTGGDPDGPGNRVWRIAEPIARALRLDIVDVECQGKGAGTTIRVFVRKDGGTGIQDCERLHQLLRRALEVDDPVPRVYRLEVSSPGLDRPLKRRVDYQQAVGQPVRISVRQPVDGQWTVRGRLAEVSDLGVALQMEARSSSGRARAGGRVVLQWEAIAGARRDVDW